MKKAAARKPSSGKGTQTKALTKRRPAEQKETTQEEQNRVTQKTALEALDMLGITSRLTDKEKRLFIALCVRNQLDPLNRELHAMERKQKITPAEGKEYWITVMVPVVGFEVYIDRAEETGRLGWWNWETNGTFQGDDLSCTVTIQRKDWPVPFKWTCFYNEVNSGSPVFTKERHHMLVKTTLSRAFRLCFRSVLKRMPYTAEEVLTIPDDYRPPMMEPQERKAVETEGERLLQAGKELDSVLREHETQTQEQKQKQEAELRGKAQADADKEKQLAVARDELATIYRSMQHVKHPNGECLWTGEELDRMGLQANEARKAGNLEALRDLAAKWLNDLMDRKEIAAKEAQAKT
jgi:hypothetical protein